MPHAMDAVEGAGVEPNLDYLTLKEFKEHIETHASYERRLDVLEHLYADLSKRVNDQGTRLNWAMALAIVGAVGGGLFGLINFVLLLQLIGRLS